MSNAINLSYQHRNTASAFAIVLNSKRYRQTTVKVYTNTFKRFLFDIAPQHPDQLAKEEVVEYVQSLSVKENTRELVLNVLRIYYKEMLSREL